MASMLLGDDGKFQPTERFFLELGMQDTLEKIPAETVAKVMNIITPLSLVAGVALYTIRVAKVVNEKQQQKNVEYQQEFYYPEQTTEETEFPTPITNGFNIRESIVPPVSKLGDLQ